jgi:hypothetical protein
MMSAYTLDCVMLGMGFGGLISGYFLAVRKLLPAGFDITAAVPSSVADTDMLLLPIEFSDRGVGDSRRRSLSLPR